MMVIVAVITITGAPGCRAEETARLSAQRMAYELVSEPVLRRMVVEEFGSETSLPDRLSPPALTAILARLARQHHYVLSAPGAESLVAEFPARLRVAVQASDKYRTGTLMLEHHLDRAAAHSLLKQLDREARSQRKRQFGRVATAPGQFDLILNAESMDPDQIAQVVESTSRMRLLTEQGMLSPAQEMEFEFRARLRLAKHGIAPAGTAALTRRPFANDSEQIFANLLDFYRIAWDYEPKSFPIQWDKNGKILEAFTPDFYLPELELYIELTTMKQAHVTKKNRKIKLLRAIYPQINIQVFYQKDFQNLVFKYGLAERALAV